MYRHILIPLENSPTDETILNHIRSLARLTEARLTLIHVADGFMARNQERFEESPEMQDDRSYLRRRQEELSDEGFAVGAILACGDPTTEIIAAAEREGCDLIAMSTHGHRFLSDLILGSVATNVRHRTTLPILLIQAARPGTEQK
ncbi:MAG: universal stress protein [Candidatus Hydrogenedentes bacterium]|nr:universal stress protein [Candidatus Hydrogenedentota bacterium]